MNQWNQWEYNVANDGSRGLDATNINKVTCWFSGPEFLWLTEAEWAIDTDFEVHDSDDLSLGT